MEEFSRLLNGVVFSNLTVVPNTIDAVGLVDRLLTAFLDSRD